MELGITIAAVVLLAGLTAFASWKSGRPRKDTHKTTWISWPLVTVFAGAFAFLCLVHAVNLMGIHTGGQQQTYSPVQ
jgi:amino acid transporter